MDFIFEEDMDDVGSDIDAYCPKCKADTAHTVISKYEDEVRKVQCSTCGDVHAFRKPRGEVEEEQPEPVSAKKRTAHRKPTWQEAIDKAGTRAVNHARLYSIREHYREGELVSHPKFGVGFVTEITENKAEVTFQDERRVLVHNRPELAAQMPAIAPVVPPRDEKGRGKKGAKGHAHGHGHGKKAEPPPPVKGAKGAKPAKVEAKPVVAKGKPPAPVAKGKPVVESKAARAKAAVVKKQAAAAKKPAPAAKKPAPPAKKPAPPAKGKAKKKAGKR